MPSGNSASVAFSVAAWSVAEPLKLKAATGAGLTAGPGFPSAKVANLADPPNCKG